MTGAARLEQSMRAPAPRTRARAAPLRRRAAAGAKPSPRKLARLFANMYAGEQVTLVFLTLTYFAVPAIFMGLHVFVSLLQAYIFMLLTMMYVSGAVSHEH